MRAPSQDRMRARFRLRSLLACAALLAGPVAAQAPGSAPEQSIKAAYLYHFGAYVGWPEQVLPPDRPLTIGILDDEPVAGELEAITHEKRVNGRRIEVRRLTADEPLDGVQMLFVGGTRAEVPEALAEKARESSVLVVTESAGGLAAGGVINFLVIDERVRFEVSLDAADASGLSISSRLLAVAEHVLPRSPQ